MTHAPADLLAVRQYLLSSTGLPGDAVGIVGDPDHAATGGYHEGNDDLARVGRVSTDYSKRESARDRPGSNAASAIDIGDFRRGGVTLRSVSLGLVAACQRGDPRTADVREVIYTPDGSSVRRFDRLGIRSTGDSSHLWHTHISFFRDSEGRRARADNVLGLLAELIEGVDDMSWDALLPDPTRRQPGPGKAGDLLWVAAWNIADTLAAVKANNAAEVARDAAARAAIDGLVAAFGKLTGGDGTIDTAPILARIDAVAAAESAAVAQLHAELVSARQESALLRERLAAALDPPAGS